MILTRYLLKEVFPLFLFIFCTMFSILLISQLVRLSDIITNFGFSLENLVFPVTVVVIPALSFLLPTAFFFAVATAFMRLNQDGEWDALLMCTYSPARALKPLLGMGGLLYLLSALSGSYLEPWGRRELENFYQRKIQEKFDFLLENRLKPNIFTEDFFGFLLYAQQVSPDKRTLRRVFLYRDTQEPPIKIFAKECEIIGSFEQKNLRLLFKNGTYFLRNAVNDLTAADFKTMEVDLVQLLYQQLFGVYNPPTDVGHLNPFELYAYSKTLEDKKQIFKIHYLLHQRMSFGFLIFSFVFLGMVFGISDRRSGKNRMLVLCIAALIGAYFAMSVARENALFMRVGPEFTAWFVPVMYLGIALIVWRIKFFGSLLSRSV